MSNLSHKSGLLPSRTRELTYNQVVDLFRACHPLIRKIAAKADSPNAVNRVLLTQEDLIALAGYHLAMEALEQANCTPLEMQLLLEAATLAQTDLSLLGGLIQSLDANSSTMKGY